MEQSDSRCIDIETPVEQPASASTQLARQLGLFHAAALAAAPRPDELLDRARASAGTRSCRAAACTSRSRDPPCLCASSRTPVVALAGARSVTPPDRRGSHARSAPCCTPSARPPVRSARLPLRSSPRSPGSPGPEPQPRRPDAMSADITSRGATPEQVAEALQLADLHALASTGPCWKARRSRTRRSTTAATTGTRARWPSSTGRSAYGAAALGRSECFGSLGRRTRIDAARRGAHRLHDERET